MVHSQVVSLNRQFFGPNDANFDEDVLVSGHLSPQEIARAPMLRAILHSSNAEPQHREVEFPVVYDLLIRADATNFRMLKGCSTLAQYNPHMGASQSTSLFVTLGLA